MAESTGGSAPGPVPPDSPDTVSKPEPARHDHGRRSGFRALNSRGFQYVTVFQGSSPFGAIFAGVMAGLVGVRGAMFIGAAALVVIGLIAAVALSRISLGRREGTASA